MNDDIEVTVPLPEDGKPLVVTYQYPDRGERWAEALRLLLEAGHDD